jgi:hypothetical protein
MTPLVHSLLTPCQKHSSLPHSQSQRKRPHSSRRTTQGMLVKMNNQPGVQAASVMLLQAQGLALRSKACRQQ